MEKTRLCDNCTASFDEFFDQRRWTKSAMLNAMAVVSPLQSLLRMFNSIKCRPYRSFFDRMNRHLESVPVHLPDHLPQFLWWRIYFPAPFMHHDLDAAYANAISVVERNELSF